MSEILGPDGEPIRRKEMIDEALKKAKQQQEQQKSNPSRIAITTLQRKLEKKRIPYLLFYILDGKTHMFNAIVPPPGTTKKEFFKTIIDQELPD